MPAPAPILAASGWSLAGLVASRGGCSLDLTAPAAGLGKTASREADRLLGLDLRSPRGEARLVDHWVRGNDLVAVYEPADPRRLRATAIWRPLPAPATGWELVVSAQTSLVESDSAVAVTASLAGEEILWSRGAAAGPADWLPLEGPHCPPEATCLLVRRGADAVLVAVHPADARQIVISRSGPRVDVACWLFSTALEKGVLLRSRVLAAVGPAADTAWADAILTPFAAAPPPLTT
jgi:hypothetical protein